MLAKNKSRRLNLRQRWALIVLAAMLLLALLALVLALFNARHTQIVTLPTTESALLPEQQQQLCYDQATAALLDADLVGSVRVGADGMLWIQIIRYSRFACQASAAFECAEPVRAWGIAGVWAVLESLAVSDGACAPFFALDMIVNVRAADQITWRTNARVLLADLRLWANAEIDDAELAARMILNSSLVLPEQ